MYLWTSTDKDWRYQTFNTVPCSGVVMDGVTVECVLIFADYTSGNKYKQNDLCAHALASLAHCAAFHMFIFTLDHCSMCRGQMHLMDCCYFDLNKTQISPIEDTCMACQKENDADS